MTDAVALLMALGLWLVPVSYAAGTTSYLSPSGSDATKSTTVSSPWKTFAYAISRLNPGDTLILLDGTYGGSSGTGYPNIQCGSGAKHGTRGEPITITAQHERQAFIQGDASAYPFRMDGCRYWIVQGLRVEWGDFATSRVPNAHVIYIQNSDRIIFRRNLIRFPNRHKNGSVVNFGRSTNSVLEENEVYSFHRNGVGGGNQNVYRRNYINSRGYRDIDDKIRGSHTANRGDSGLIFYPSSHNVAENNISEGNDKGYDFQARGPTDNNRLYGNISLHDRYGALVQARGRSASTVPRDNVFEHFLALNYEMVGLYSRAADGTTCRNCTFDGGTSGRHGLVADRNSATWPGDGLYSFYGTNILAVHHRRVGVLITGDMARWTLEHVNSYAGNPHYSPTSSANYSHQLSIPPQLGSCRAFIPDASPMKKAGKHGGDIGANILYVYENGSLTDQPLWNPASGQFPCGAIVPGVNDIAGQSCFDVHKRLNVHTSGCSLPGGYAGPWPPAPGPLADGGG